MHSKLNRALRVEHVCLQSGVSCVKMSVWSVCQDRRDELKKGEEKRKKEKKKRGSL